MRRFLTVFAALTALALAGAASAAEPSPPVQTPAPEGTYFLRAERDTSIIYLRLPDSLPTGSTAQAWKMLYLRKPVYQDGAGTTRYGAVLDEYDCQTPRMRTLATVAFADDDRVNLARAETEDWHDIQPNTNAQYDRALACTGKPLAGDEMTVPLAGRAAWRADAEGRNK